jgi:hypothetical protein
MLDLFHVRRRHVHTSEIVHIGKEANNIEDEPLETGKVQIFRNSIMHDNSVWWHTGETEFESSSTFERQRYLIWERYKIPEWLSFLALN